jgi:two-component system chemotaxis response regulator CheB/chemosensory pili system protein ChpB (putative protein-glutamate methylesterase)
VVVNLDAGMEAQLDSVHALLDDPRYNVIFNDAQVSGELQGWERARWLRHLVAKVRGAGDVDPPRPSGHADAASATAPGDHDAATRMNQDGAGAVPATAEPAADAARFGIETISAETYLAPVSTATAETQVEPAELELMPMEEAIAPVAGATTEAWLDPQAKGSTLVSKVWVVGASIGGPEALAEFFAALPRGYPAVFLVVQRMAPDLLQRLAQRLAAGTAMRVVEPGGGEAIADGDIVLVPPGRLPGLGHDGRLTLRDTVTGECVLDRLIHDTADRLGRRAGAILFSGTLAEAVDGCRHMVARGGVVCAQDAASCIGGGMDDNAEVEVAFAGTPRQLAAQLLDPAWRRGAERTAS